MNLYLKKIIKVTLSVALYGFAIIGLILTVGYLGVLWGFTNTSGIIDTQRSGFYSGGSAEDNLKISDSTIKNPVWAKTEEWAVFKEAVIKDKDEINRAAFIASTSPRIIFANLAVEQLRLFFTTREIYKKIFYPIKILGVQSQFSLGVMGIKNETAAQVENNLKNTDSDFYLGKNFEHLLDFESSSTENFDQIRFERLTNQHNRYYSYLYSALLIKEIETQWKNAGFKNEISNPAIISTLYNIGFEHSKPNANPQVGGAKIDIASTTYSFGGLASEIYYSDELRDFFPE